MYVTRKRTFDDFPPIRVVCSFFPLGKPHFIQMEAFLLHSLSLTLLLAYFSPWQGCLFVLAWYVKYITWLLSAVLSFRKDSNLCWDYSLAHGCRTEMQKTLLFLSIHCIAPRVSRNSFTLFCGTLNSWVDAKSFRAARIHWTMDTPQNLSATTTTTSVHTLMQIYQFIYRWVPTMYIGTCLACRMHIATMCAYADSGSPTCLLTTNV